MPAYFIYPILELALKPLIEKLEVRLTLVCTHLNAIQMSLQNKKSLIQLLLQSLLFHWGTMPLGSEVTLIALILLR